MKMPVKTARTGVAGGLAQRCGPPWIDPKSRHPRHISPPPECVQKI
jgi:hypothetical protein